MPGREQANIGIWPKSSGYSRCLDITWNAKATIVSFCSDFLVRECLHSLFCNDFVLSIFWRKQNINRNEAFSICWHVINKWRWLVQKNPALRNLHQWCKCCAAAWNESAKRCNNFTRCLQHHYFLTHVTDERQQVLHSTPALRHLHLWKVHCFAPARHAHCRILARQTWTAHWALL